MLLQLIPNNASEGIDQQKDQIPGSHLNFTNVAVMMSDDILPGSSTGLIQLKPMVGSDPTHTQALTSTDNTTLSTHHSAKHAYNTQTPAPILVSKKPTVHQTIERKIKD